MNTILELMAHSRQTGFACSLDQTNPELAELEELRRQSLPTTDLPPDHGPFRKLVGPAVALGVALAMVIGSRWGVA